ncbi:MAG TPA: DUF6152 family protein [Steroidobacteraceae bacterium]|nr:DUF6152 family protein [Steroidobacteraceae bacterium]
MSMQKSLRPAVASAMLSLGTLCAAATALAHHSFALFDHTNRVTVTGTVVKFDWSNPHVFIELEVPEGAGTRHYSVECASPNVLTRVGWKYNDIRKGDKVTLLINPLRNGQPGGMLERATLADGRMLSDGNPPAGVFPRE